MEIKEGLLIRIVPTEIENSFETKISKIDENNIYFQLNNNAMCVGEIFDAYAISDSGILFFSACVDKMEDNIVGFSKNIKPEMLQRRQYMRIKLDDDVIITDADNKIEAWMVDISAGGFKLHLKKPLELNKKYCLNITLNTKDLSLNFSPINCIKEMENLYTVSARFENIKNTDKITLVQYCYKKQAENVNE